MDKSNQAYERARKRVDTLKGFYSHLKVFIIVNVLLITAKLSMADWIIEQLPGLPERWININIFLTPVIWGVALAIHGIYVFRHKFTFLRKWEEDKIREILEDENKDNYR